MKEGKTYDLHIYTGVELLFYLSFALKDNGVFFKRQVHLSQIYVALADFDYPI
jgi:hypothetical protein